MRNKKRNNSNSAFVGSAVKDGYGASVAARALTVQAIVHS